MSTQAIPVFLFAAASIGLAVGMIVIGTLLGPRRQSAVKKMPYESGMDPVHDTRRRFDVRFHLVAIAFLILMSSFYLYIRGRSRVGVRPESMRLSVTG